MERIKTAKLRKDALDIFKAGLRSVDPALAVQNVLQPKNGVFTLENKTYDLKKFENIYVIGAGKASAAMAQALEDILSNRITAGFINVKYGHSRPLKTITVQESGHPVPDAAGLEGSKRILSLLDRTGEKDLVIFFEPKHLPHNWHKTHRGLLCKSKQRTETQ